MYLLAVLGLHCCGLFSSGSKWGLLASCGALAKLLCGMSNLPRPEIKSMSPALVGG